MCSNPDLFTGWTNTDSFNGSDHSILLFLYNCTNPCVGRMVRNIANTNWNTFRESLPPLPDQVLQSQVDLEKCAVNLIENVKWAFNLACPLKKTFPGKPRAWWNSDLTNLLRKKNLATKEMRRYKGTQKGR